MHKIAKIAAFIAAAVLINLATWAIIRLTDSQYCARATAAGYTAPYCGD